MRADVQSLDIISNTMKSISGSGDERVMKPENFISEEQFAVLLAAAKTPRERCILELLGYAGLRAAETVSIRVEDIDFKRSFVNIIGKRNKFRTVVLLPRVIAALQAYLDGRESGYLFPSKASTSHITVTQLQHIFSNIAERSGLQATNHVDAAGKTRHVLHPHVLRHSFAIWSLDSGKIPINDLQAQLGHESLATTGIYLKCCSPNHRRDNYLKSGLGDEHD